MDIYDSEGYSDHPFFPTCKVHHTAIVGSNVQLGKNNIIMPYAIIGQSGFIRESENPSGKIIIGDGNVIGCYVNIMAGSEGKTFVGNKNLIMNHANIGHNVTIYDNCEIGAGSILNGYSTIWNNVKIKSGCIIRNRIKIAQGSLIGQGTNVTKDLEVPGVYYGNPVRMIRRNEPIRL